MSPIRDKANELLHRRMLTGFSDLRHKILDASTEQGSNCPLTEREHDGEVVLTARLHRAMQSLNPGVPLELIKQAIDQLTQSRNLVGLAQANQQVYKLLKDGIKLDAPSSEVGSAEEQDAKITVQFINWKEPLKNDFLLVTNFAINGQLGRGRLSYVGFVNGLPWLLPVVRIAEQRQDLLHNLYETEIKDYKRRFPQLFWYNALILLSNGTRSKVGSMTGKWEHFVEWKRVENEDEPEDTTLKTLLKGTCEKTRLLDIVENFTLFSQQPEEGLIKIVARYHQYIGVNAAFARMQHIKELGGKIGVFWHTQGAGKSYSMLFFEQKVQRKLRGNWTFVVVTDRLDLDKQIYQNFSHAGVITEPEERVRAADRADLRLLLSEDHSILFTLIHKFRTDEPQQVYPKISDRDDIIIMTDEAHRSEYDTLAKNMRTGLPNASFIGFTGTPLIEAAEHETRETFGPYISKYPFLQAIRDGVTVRLIYENRTPEILLNVSKVAEAIQKLESQAGLNEKQKQKLKRELLQNKTIVASGPRLDFVAQDIVQHFMQRGYQGKAMIACIDKITTVRMYNRVYHEWLRYRDDLERQLQQENDPERQAELAKDLTYMRSTEMAVVISGSDESEEKAVKEFNEEHEDEQVDFRPHHERFEKEDLAEDFKKASHPLRIAFVCSMWMTGFDAPCLSTLYLDHPMQDHTLMQALARPNRVFGAEKTCGLIVDYVGIYDDLLAALNTYAGSDLTADELDMPLSDKSELIGELEKALVELDGFCQQNGVDTSAALTALEATHSKLERDTQIQAAANKLVMREDTKFNYLSLAWDAYRLYQALLPDKEVSRFTSRIFFFRQVQQTIFAAMTGQNDISSVLIKARKIVAEGMSTERYIPRQLRHDPDASIGSFDLSQIDFDELAASIQASNSYLKAEQLRSILGHKLQQMIRVNPKRVDYLQRLQDIVTKYNRDSANNADYPEEIVEFARQMGEEEKRHEREGLSEEELAIVDQLLAPDLHLNASDREQVKQAARRLLKDLKGSNRLVHDWYKKSDMNSGVRKIIKDVLDQMLPTTYTKELFDQLCEDLYLHIRTQYESYGSNSGPISA